MSEHHHHHPHEHDNGATPAHHQHPHEHHHDPSPGPEHHHQHPHEHHHDAAAKHDHHDHHHTDHQRKSKPKHNDDDDDDIGLECENNIINVRTAQAVQGAAARTSCNASLTVNASLGRANKDSNISMNSLTSDSSGPIPIRAGGSTLQMSDDDDIVRPKHHKKSVKMTDIDINMDNNINHDTIGPSEQQFPAEVQEVSKEEDPESIDNKQKIDEVQEDDNMDNQGDDPMDTKLESVLHGAQQQSQKDSEDVKSPKHHNHKSKKAHKIHHLQRDYVAADDHKMTMSEHIRRYFHHFLEYQVRQHRVHHRKSDHGHFHKGQTELMAFKKKEAFEALDHSHEYRDGYQEVYPYLTVGYPIIQIVFYVVFMGIEGLEFDGDGPYGPEPMFYSLFTSKCSSGCPILLEDQRWQLWRNWSYGLLHADFLHLFGNIMMEIGLGAPLEIVHGHLRMSEVIFYGVLAGGVFHGLFTPSVPVVGSSGYAYALAGMHISNLFMNWKEIGKDHVTFIPYIPNNISRLILILLWMGVNILNLASSSSVINGDASHGAHGGGFLIGIFLGFKYLRNIVHPKYEKYLAHGGIIFSVVTVIVVFILGVIPSEPNALIGKNCTGLPCCENTMASKGSVMDGNKCPEFGMGVV